MILSPGIFGHSAGALPLWGLAASALALLAYGVAGFLGEPAQTEHSRGMRWVLLCAWVSHALAIVLEMAVLDPGAELAGARFGFAPALSVTAWLVLTVYWLESRFLPISGMRRSLAWLGAAAVSLAALFPGEMRPLATSPWQPVHWVLGIASYGLFGAAVLHGALLRRADRQMRLHATALAPLGLPLLKLEQLTFRFVAWGFAVLTLTLLLGWWFANPWRWDHKAVLSLLSWLVFACLLLGRQMLGWRGPVATRWLFVGAGMLLLAYVGSRFVLEVVLHRAAV